MCEGGGVGGGQYRLLQMLPSFCGSHNHVLAFLIEGARIRELNAFLNTVRVRARRWSRAEGAKVAAKKKHTETMLGKSREKCRVTDKSCQIGGRKKKKEKKKLMNEFNNQEKPSMWGCRMWKIFLFFWWLKE